MDTANALNDYLTATYGITLERVLLDATTGVVTLALRRNDDATMGAVDIVCDPVGRHIYDDEGIADQYQGYISCEGVVYRFTCATFTDASGARYVETIGELEVVEWRVSLQVPAADHRVSVIAARAVCA
jgi:hypothetical protein